jgi:hypothetical protein
MRARPGTDALVIRTHLIDDDTNRFLLLPVHARDGRTVTLTLRLRCGFPTALRLDPRSGWVCAVRREPQ